MSSLRYGDYVIAYDVSDDRERSAVDKILIGYGFRVQKSVFTCNLSRGERERLLAALRATELTTGHIMVWRLQANAQRTDIGTPPTLPEDQYAFIV